MKHVGARKDLVNGLVASLLGNAQRRANICWTWQLMEHLHTKYEPDLTTFSIANSREYFFWQSADKVTIPFNKNGQIFSKIAIFLRNPEYNFNKKIHDFQILHSKKF